MTCLIVPSFPAASMAWKMSNSDQRSCAYNTPCNSASALHARLQRFFCARLVRRLQVTGIGRIDMFESEFVSVRYAIRFGELMGGLDDFASFHFIQERASIISFITFFPRACSGPIPLPGRNHIPLSLSRQ